MGPLEVVSGKAPEGLDKTRVGSGGSGKETAPSGWDTGVGKFHGSWQDASIREGSRRSSKSAGTDGSRGLPAHGSPLGTLGTPGKDMERGDVSSSTRQL